MPKWTPPSLRAITCARSFTELASDNAWVAREEGGSYKLGRRGCGSSTRRDNVKGELWDWRNCGGEVGRSPQSSGSWHLQNSMSATSGKCVPRLVFPEDPARSHRSRVGRGSAGLRFSFALPVNSLAWGGWGPGLAHTPGQNRYPRPRAKIDREHDSITLIIS